MENYQDLISQATVVKNETGPRENSAIRVGSLFLNLINTLKSLDDGIDERLTAGIGEINNLLVPITDKIQYFKGLTTELDSLKTIQDFGCYYYAGTHFTGIVSVGFNYMRDITQTCLASATPTAKGYDRQPAVISRSYINGSWSAWQVASDKDTIELINNKVTEINSAITAMGKKVDANTSAIAELGQKTDEKFSELEEDVINVIGYSLEKDIQVTYGETYRGEEIIAPIDKDNVLFYRLNDNSGVLTNEADVRIQIRLNYADGTTDNLAIYVNTTQRYVLRKRLLAFSIVINEGRIAKSGIVSIKVNTDGLVSDIEKHINEVRTEVASVENNLEEVKATADKCYSGYVAEKVEEYVEVPLSAYTIQGGINNDGIETTSTNCTKTDFIPLGNATKIHVSYYIGTSFTTGALYDNDKKFLFGINSKSLLNQVYTGVWIAKEINVDIATMMGNVGVTTTPAYIRFVEWNNKTVETALNASYNQFVDNDVKVLTKNDISKGNLIIVDATGEKGYTSLQEAIDNAGDTKDNPVTILVLPGRYETPTCVGMEDRNKAHNRHLSIIGTDKNNCVIFNKKANYQSIYSQYGYEDNACLRLGGNCYIANLTFISTDDEYVEKTGGAPDAYCVHFDYDCEEGDVIEMHNCVLKNNHGSCIGFGTRPNAKMIISNCRIERTGNLREGTYFFALFGHNFGTDTSKKQHLSLVDNIITTTTSHGIYIYAPNNVEVEVEAARNIVIAQAAKWFNGKVSLSATSFGNNKNDLNK